MHQRLLATLFAVAALVAVVAAGCGSDSPGVAPRPSPTPGIDVSEELAAARARWDASGWGDYAFFFNWQCFCGPDRITPVHIEVGDAHITKVRWAREPDAGTILKPEIFRTINGLFDMIEDAIDRDAVRIDATYDPILGHPVSVFIDYEKFTVDEEQGFQVSGVSELTESDTDHPQGALDLALVQWAEADLINYEFTFQWKCFCSPDETELVRVRVVSGDVTSVEYIARGPLVGGEPDVGRYHSINGLFDYIQEALDSGLGTIEVEYDPMKGYPLAGHRDLSSESGDDDRLFSVTNLVAN